MTIAERVKFVNEKLEEWAQGQDKLVVAIDGYTGVGKTTLAEALAKLNPEIVLAHYDDFLLSSREIREKMQADGTDNREEVIHHDLEGIKELVATFKQTGKNIEHPVFNIFETKIFNPETQEMDIPKIYDFMGKKILIMDGVFMFQPQRLNSLWDKRIYLDGDVAKIDERRVAREKARWGEKYYPEDRPDSQFGQLTRALKRYREQYQPEKMTDLTLWID